MNSCCMQFSGSIQQYRQSIPIALALLEGVAEVVGPNVRDLNEVHIIHVHTNAQDHFWPPSMRTMPLGLRHSLSSSTVTHCRAPPWNSNIYKYKNEVGCRDDTVPKTVDTRRHCEEE